MVNHRSIESYSCLLHASTVHIHCYASRKHKMIIFSESYLYIKLCLWIHVRISDLYIRPCCVNISQTTI